MKRRKKMLATLLSVCLLVPSVSSFAAGEPKAVEVPDPYYEFTFDGDVDGNKVENEGTKTGVTATIGGSGQGLGIAHDDVRGSNVLNLPGGGLDKGYLTLPDNMYEDVTDAGFAFSFWIEIDANASQYSRIFSSSPIALNSNDGDGGRWNAPEFTFVAGLEGAGDLGAGSPGYNSSIMLSDKSSQMKLVWDKQFTKAQWQHVTISVTPSTYDVYLDGSKIGMTFDRNNNMKAILTALFKDNAAELKKYTHNAIGRSVYTTDADLKARMDEFRFYNVALTADQAKAAYESYAVSTDVLKKLENKIKEANALSISFYTQSTYEKLMAKVSEAQSVLENPVTEANVNRVHDELTQAVKDLKFYKGVTADTKFTNAQLKEEADAAKDLGTQEGLTAASKKALEDALKEAEEVLKKDEEAGQAAVDAALKTLRAAVAGLDFGATLKFDASKNTGDMLHGSTGFLYGVSEVNVPSANLIEAIKPKFLVQKAADGQQHPSGDGYRLTDYLENCDVENIQIYLQDYYLEWPYEYNGIDDYNAKVDKIVRKMVEGKTAEEIAHYSFVIFNEPDGIWYGSDVNRMCKDWLKIYTTIKSINPAIKVVGPNYAGFNTNYFDTFFKYCEQNDCLPEYVTWHELNKGSLTAFPGHYEFVQGLIDTYYADSDIEPVIVINETVNFDDIGTPGSLVNWIALFEEYKTYACLPYWGLANSLNELAADANKPNGAWWVYKWYAQMSGHTVPMEMVNVGNPGPYGRLYGLTSVDEDNQTIQTIFGGQAGEQTIQIQNIKDTKMFQDASSAHVKIYSTKYTGHQGFADEIPVEFEGNVKISGNNLILTIPNAELMDAYYAVITPATSEETTTIANYEKEKWEATYEAENATLLGNAKAFTKTGGGDLARSNRAEVGGINKAGDGAEFNVDVPKDGTYRLNVYYSNQAPQVDPQTLQYVENNGQNRAIGAIVTHELAVDGEKVQDMKYDSTVKWGYYNYKTVYLNLKKGSHKIKVTHAGEDQSSKTDASKLSALLDKIDLTYEPDQAADIVIEPEELAGSQKGYTLAQDGKYEGAGYAAGSGDFEFYVNAPREGYYTVGTKGSGNIVLSKGIVEFAEDAKAESEVGLGWQELLKAELGKENMGSVYLEAGQNRMKVSGKDLKFDQIIFTEAKELTEKGSIVIEAEDAELKGTDPKDNYNYLPGGKAVPTVVESSYASGGKVVEGFRGGQDNEMKLSVNVPEDGNYKLSVVYSNNEPAPVMKKQDGSNYVHPYNTDLVERYAQIKVNGGKAQTVYFRNTFCWDVYRNAVVDVVLKKGDNTITLTNDNSYKFSSVQDDFTPRFDKFVVAPSVAASVQEEVELPYTDVKEDDWFYPYVKYMYEYMIMTGLDKTTFGPAENLSRAQFATILYRMEKSPKVSYKEIFPDVPDGLFYSEAVIWANSEGVDIISGYEDGTFGPADHITREQMAVMLYRYAKYKGYDLSADNDLSEFPDKNLVSAFSQKAMQWAVGEEIISGNADKTLAPQGKASRAVCATMMTRFLENMK